MIYTDRLILRPWKEEDLAPYAAMNADPRVREYFPGVLTTEESYAEVRRFQQRFRKEGFGLLTAELRSEQTCIGFIGMQTMSFAVPSLPQPAVEIGWRLAAPFWGKGLATEGARAVLKYAFDVAGLEQVVAIAAHANVRSLRVMERLGMKHVPELDFDHPRIAEGHPLRATVLYRITREMYA